MDNKFFLAMVWILCAAVVASLAYGLGDGLKWLARRLAAGWLFFAMVFAAAYAMPASARSLVRIKFR
ncbi:MAG: hypothetical protein IPH37_04125 [Burkholderiales bacterium]|nr:hypothetical protein [Burkholderiales bacterium]